MDSRIGTYSDKDGNGFVKPQVTVTGGKLQKNVAHNTRGIGGRYFVYLDGHKHPKADLAIEELSAIDFVKASQENAIAELAAKKKEAETKLEAKKAPKAPKAKVNETK